MEDIINNINIEEFISQIEARPAIWELSSDDYNKKAAKKYAWEEVITKFYPQFERTSSSERNNIALRFQRKWKSLRDCYSRELLKIKKEKGAPANRKRYRYYNQLSFLQTVVKPISVIENVDNCSQMLTVPIKKETEEQRRDTEASIKSGSRNKKSTSSSDMKQVLEEDTKLSEENQMFVNVAEKLIRERCQETMEKDEDTLFALSLVAELKKIPDDIKFDVKCELLKVFKKARFSLSFRPSTSTPSTCLVHPLNFPPLSNQCQLMQGFRQSSQSNANRFTTTHTQTATSTYPQTQSPLSSNVQTPSPTSSQTSQNSYIDFAENM
ncbi:PREDICTED: uncharacterized protein LOC107072525 isoform X2 [Polistes dominula]|uniref:Uncharacterized protein LOC107072525 isoform X2 n=1 Tax=Polistes dominula TaxID=743375 RepID=A0ABM1J6C7_POLDO|nr:PREDICTED: uncharacterized protein LOC107072525 isoform X2 [Polistes dominula]